MGYLNQIMGNYCSSTVDNGENQTRKSVEQNTSKILVKRFEEKILREFEQFITDQSWCEVNSNSLTGTYSHTF